MPIYAYKCDSCAHRQDVLQKMSEPTLSVCPACGAASFVKQVTAAGFQLKGSGWYATDFRGGNAPAAPEDAAAKPADGKPTEGKPTDGKPSDGKAAETKPTADAAGSKAAAAPAAAAANPASGKQRPPAADPA